MNRRSFIGTLAKAFTILPGAGRVWKVERELYWPTYKTYRVAKPIEVVPWFITSRMFRCVTAEYQEYLERLVRDYSSYRLDRFMDGVLDSHRGFVVKPPSTTELDAM